MSDEDAQERLVERAGAWRVVVDEVFETVTSLVAYGRCGSRAVVLKIVKQQGDEWESGDVLKAFDANGMVRTYEHVPGAILMERLSPGNSLVDLAISDRDEEATAVVAAVIDAIATSRDAGSHACPTVQDWGRGFDKYLATADESISRDLVSEAHHMFEELCQSMSNARLLHGDLQHSNILFDEERGWVAIDPKGVIGEIEYEIGAALRNPREAPLVFTSPATIERRIRQLSNALELEPRRVLNWAFAQAVLSAIWVIEDGGQLEANDPTIALAETTRRMLPSFSP